MKKALKWIFFVILIVIFAIDVAGFWKYKLKKSNNTQTQVATSAEGESDATPEETNQEENIEYTELTSKKFSNGEKLFIKDISEESDGVYEIKGLIYEECRITSEEYKNLKSGKSTVEILGVEYSKDKIESNNIKLKSSDEKAPVVNPIAPIIGLNDDPGAYVAKYLLYNKLSGFSVKFL